MGRSSGGSGAVDAAMVINAYEDDNEVRGERNNV